MLGNDLKISDDIAAAAGQRMRNTATIKYSNEIPNTDQLYDCIQH